MVIHGSAYSPDDLKVLYRERFDQDELATKKVAWKALCEKVFQADVPENGSVVDLGAGNCEFSNAITARRRIAVDLNPDTKRFADPDVEVLITSCTDMSELASGSIDTVFTSNFFEHLPNKEILLETLREVHRTLRPGGKIVVLMPNIRYLDGRYWDYLDHHLPLTHVSLVEALELSKFTPLRVVPQFLPFTVRQSKLPISRGLILAYLKLPLLWRVMGKQMLVVARSTD